MNSNSRWTSLIYQIYLSFWKKRPLILAGAIMISFIILIFQYKSVSGDKSNLGHMLNSKEDPYHFTSHKSIPKAEKIIQPSASVEDFSQIKKPFQKISISLSPEGNYIPPYRLVHLDLKGAPPKLSYFRSIFPIISAAGATGLLIEYEDMFPYWGMLKDIVAHNAYSRKDVEEILNLAKQNNLEVIPLIPTFGHLEFVLKIEKFRHLREVDTFPMAICPSQNESIHLIKTMIDQIILLHQNVKFLHIGLDEVYHIGYCKLCEPINRDQLFLYHAKKIASYVREKHKVIPIIWDDMLRNIMQEDIKKSGLGKLVEPMIWTYVKYIDYFVNYQTITSYSEVFSNIWAASAFKGAFGETLTVPNVKMHLDNNIAWIETMTQHYKNFKSFRGIAFTGWQRYDHLATLCETLPAGLPSLIIDLLTVTNGGYQSSFVIPKFEKLMSCHSNSISSKNDLNFDFDPYLWSRFGPCNFPGSSIFRLTQTVESVVKQTNDYINDVTVKKAWLTDYNVRNEISNPYRIDEALKEFNSVRENIIFALKSARSALSEAFDEFTVAEWIEQNIYPYLLKLDQLKENAMKLRKQRTWLVRPLKLKSGKISTKLLAYLH